LREVYGKVIKDAFKAGISEAWGFWHMTPAEVNGRITAFEAQQDTALQRLDAVAWMAGSYAAHAYHEPKRYPKKPCIVQTGKKTPLPGDEPMDEALMKDMLGMFAKSHNTRVEKAGGETIGGNAGNAAD